MLCCLGGREIKWLFEWDVESFVESFVENVVAMLGIFEIVVRLSLVVLVVFLNNFSKLGIVLRLLNIVRFLLGWLKLKSVVVEKVGVL